MKSSPFQESSPAGERGYRKVELMPNEKGAIQWSHFPDGWPNLFIDNVKQCAGKDG